MNLSWLGDAGPYVGYLLLFRSGDPCYQQKMYVHGVHDSTLQTQSANAEKVMTPLLYMKMQRDHPGDQPPVQLYILSVLR